MSPIRLQVALIAVAAFPCSSIAQRTPVNREIAAFHGGAADYAPSADGKRIYAFRKDSLFLHDVAAQRTTFVTSGWFDGLSISPRGDRLVYPRKTEEGSATHVWTLALDPATGLARGAPQRVSVGQGNEPRVTLDGRNVIFVAGTGKELHDIAIVPVEGGPERVLAHFEQTIAYIDADPDGKSALAFLRATPTADARVMRIPLDGGKSTTVASAPAVAGATLAWDGHYITYRARGAAETHVNYVTPSGAKGEFDRGNSGGWGRTDLIRGERRFTWLHYTIPTSLNILDLATGKSRSVLPEGTQGGRPAWSPDGKRLASLYKAPPLSKTAWSLMLADADGSHRVILPIAAEPFVNNQLLWSPDGRFLALHAENMRKLLVVDVATQKARVVSSAAHIGEFRWRANSQSIVFGKDSGSVSSASAWEVGLDGRERMLRDIGREFPALHKDASLRLVSDELVQAGNGSERLLIPIAGGATHSVPGSVPRMLGPVLSPDGTTIVQAITGAGGSPGALALSTRTGDSLRMVPLPFEPRGLSPVFNRSGDAVILVGGKPGDQSQSLYMVPLNGTAPRMLTTLSGNAGGFQIQLSPDGKSLGYTLIGEITATVYSVDMTVLTGNSAKP